MSYSDTDINIKSLNDILLKHSFTFISRHGKNIYYNKFILNISQ